MSSDLDLPLISVILSGWRPPPTGQAKAPEAAEVPPVSTAPPELGRGKRKKIVTARMAEARDRRLL